MAEIRLQKNLISVVSANSEAYGGSQNFWKKSSMQGYGCGIIAVANLLLYMGLVPDVNITGGKISKDEYMTLCNTLRHRYFPIIPRFGINGIELSAGVNRYFRVNRIPMRASWFVPEKKLYSEIGRMLSEDIPVIIAAGPGFPRIWKKDRLSLYDADMHKASSCRAHYMTVTAMDDDGITVSSWGRKYYIRKSDYSEYVKKSSNTYLSSILKITKKDS